MGRRETLAKKAETLPVLEKSALQNGGIPEWRRLERELGINRTSLRRWWYAAHPDATRGQNSKRPRPPLPAPQPRPDLTEGAGLPVPAGLQSHIERARALLELEREDLAPALVGELLHERQIARELGAANVAGRMTSELPQVVAMFRQDVREVEAEDLPRAEFEQRLTAAAAGMPDRDLELVMQAYGERHNGRILFVGEGGHQAELVDGEWVLENG